MPTARPARTLLAKDGQGEFKIEVPEGCSLTFGPAVPYAPKNGYGERPHGYALRVYKGNKDNLLAVFNGVEWFRDVGMTVHRLVVRESGKSVWKSDETGYKVETEVKRDTGWEKRLLEDGGSHI